MKRNAADIFAIIIGWFLIAEGIWGFFSPVVFGMLSTNTTHAVIELILGIVGVGVGYGKRAWGYDWFLGSILLVVGVLYFIPGPSRLVVDILNVNSNVAVLNIIVAVVAFIVAASGRVHTPISKRPTIAH